MKRILVTAIFIIFVISLSACAKGPYEYENKTEFDMIFDEVARNFGAVEAAYYTFTMEFERVPESLQEMIDTGHLRVKWANPYTGKAVKQTCDRDPGDINWELLDDGNYITTSAYYIDWNDNKVTRWMTKTIWPYTHKALHEWIFTDDVSREEQLVRVYCLQFEDALESFQQRFGRMPYNYEELTNGDYNVAYINPMTSEVVKNSPELSPGDFWYERIDDEHFAIVGWGAKEPVYFMSNDRSRMEFEWEGDFEITPNAGEVYF